MSEKSYPELKNRISFLEKELKEKCNKKELAEQFEQLLNTSHDTFYNRNLASNKYEYISKSIEGILGFTDEEFINLPLEQVVELIHPEDKKSIDNFFAAILNSKENIPKFSIEYRMKDKTENYHWISERITVIKDTAGNPTNLLGNLRDNTQKRKIELLLKESEERFRGYTESAPIGIYTTNKNGDCTYANKRWLEMAGLKFEQALGKGWVNALHPEDKWSISEKWYKSVQSNGEWGYEYRFKNKKEKTTWVYGIAVALKENGKITGYLGSNIDITELKNAEKELKEKEKELTELNNTKDKFFSIIAHDLKSPFSSIIGFSQLLLKKIQSKQLNEIERFSEIVLSEAQHSMNLLTNLLEWSRTQTGNIKYIPSELNLTELIADTIELLEGAAKQKQIGIEFKNREENIITADYNMLTAVIRNILSNAIKFTHNNGRITIKINKSEKHAGIIISDNGIGMTKEQVNKLFKLDQTRSMVGTNNEKGTGLGLLVCKEFIEKHNGTINIESQPDKGTSFNIEIPI